MANKYLLDSSAWIEYFAGTEKGMKIKQFINDAQIYTTGVIVAEVSTHFLKKGLHAGEAISAIRSLAQLVHFDFNLGQKSAEIYIKERKTQGKFGLADAHVVATARTVQAKLITCDYDFLSISEAIVIK